MSNSESRKRQDDLGNHERVERIAKHIAARLYRAGWDQLPESDKHASRALAELAIADVAAGDAP